jgi:hypothetical protein
MNTGQQLRKKIFDSYSDNLIKVQQVYDFKLGVETEFGTQFITDKLYVCPLCADGFLEEMLDQRRRNPLTLEHLPPKSVGGKARILTCKKCNNYSGSNLDKLILNSLEAESFLKLKPNSSISTKLKINNKYYLRSKAKLIQKEKYQLIFKIKQSRYFNACLDEMKMDWRNTEINVSFNLPNKTNTAVALLRIGYILAFYYLGNRLLYEGSIHKIREAILNSDTVHLPHSGVYLLEESDSVSEGIHLLVGPSEFRSYFIIFRIKIASYSKMIAVPIPGPGEDGWKNYSKLQELEKGTQLNFRDITSNDYIQNKELVNAYDYIFANG